MRLADAFRTLERLGVGDRAEHVAADRQVIDLHRQGDSLVIGLLLVYGQSPHVVGVGGPLVAEVPDVCEITVGEVVAVLASGRRFGDGHLGDFVGDGEHVAGHRLGGIVNERFHHG